jgi:hypothetical protein
LPIEVRSMTDNTCCESVDRIFRKLLTFELKEDANAFL